MKETFDEYKQTIESNLINFTYLYDGDVINSTVGSYEEVRETSSISPVFIIGCINKIYQQSIQYMFDKKPITISLAKDNINDINEEISKIESVNFKPLYVFGSDLFIKTYNYNSIKDYKRPFPPYFYKLKSFSNKGFDIYECPLIDDNINNYTVYVTNKSIQSLVYSIQNMDYEIVKEGLKYKHVIRYNLYQCDYDVYKLSIKDISTLREERINKLLND